jgi:hypothetical protein
MDSLRSSAAFDLTINRPLISPFEAIVCGLFSAYKRRTSLPFTQALRIAAIYGITFQGLFSNYCH